MFLTPKQANDKDLITQLAEQIIQRPVFSVKESGGQIAYNYEINNKWILKLPSHRTDTDHWVDQSQYMPKLQDRLKYQIPIPVVSNIQFGKNNLLGCFYPKIQGETLSKATFYQRNLKQKIHFFEQLSDAMEQIHQIKADSLGYTFPDFLQQTATFLFKNEPEKQALFSGKVKSYLAQHKIYPQNNLLCHTDLHSNNVVLDGNQKLVGLLDFDTLSRADIYAEFRPGLYQTQDLNLFRQIYQEQTKTPISPKIVQCMHQLYRDALLLFSIGSLIKSANIRLKPKTRLMSPKDIKRTFGANTDRWGHFGRN
jgi:aminoglycoside phosphotransferase (APT) family kinase protein